jgi:hypothetical protein
MKGSVTSCILVQSIPRIILYVNTLFTFCFLSVIGEFSHSYKVNTLCILIFSVLGTKLEDIIF